VEEGRLSIQTITHLALPAGAAIPSAISTASIMGSPVNNAIPDPHQIPVATLPLTPQQFQRGF
jgi:hypothetical protein